MRIGVDLGGTKIEAIEIDEDGSEHRRRRVPTPDGYADILDAIVALVGDSEGTVGVGTPGAISPATGLLKNSNTVSLNGRPLHTDLAAALGREVRLANDANCFALSEAIDGAAADADVVFGVILGTGAGGGIIVNKRPLVGPNAIAGEWGHNPLPWPRDDERPGPLCYCGAHGCIETFVSGPARLRDDDPVLYENRLARALAHVINIVDPDVVVLGGGVSNVDSLYENVPKLWGEWVFSDHTLTRLVRNAHGDSGGVRGAAWLWPR